MFDRCAADSTCNAAFPHLRNEFLQISARLSSGSMRVTVPGHRGTVALDRGRVAEWFRSKLYRPKSSAALPWMIDRAYLGDWSPISEGILSDARENDLSFGLFFAITCSEDIPFIRENDVAAETRWYMSGLSSIMCCSNSPLKGTRPEGLLCRRNIVNLCGHPCRPCLPPVIPMAARRFGCVLRMFSSLRVKVPAQPDGGEGLEICKGYRREAGSPGSMDQMCESMDKNRIQGVSVGRAANLPQSSISIKDAKR